MVTRQPGKIGATLYVDVQNLGPDDLSAANVISYVLSNWPAAHPRITAVSLYTNPGDNERWEAILRECVSKQMRSNRTWPFAGVQPRENVPAMQQYSRNRAKNTADIALCLDACRDFLQERTEFVAVLSNDSDFFVLYSKCREWQEDIAGRTASGNDIPFLLVTHQGQQDGGRLSPNMVAIPSSFRWELPEEAKESPAARLTPEEIARNLVLKADVDVGLQLAYFQGLMKEDQVLQEHPAASYESDKYESYFNQDIWPVWIGWGVTRSSARIGQDTHTFFTVSASTINRVAREGSEPSVAPDTEATADSLDSGNSPVLIPDDSPLDTWEDPETRNVIVGLVAECFSKPEYIGKEGRDRAYAYFKANFGSHRLAKEENGGDWEGFWWREITPVFQLVRDVVTHCHSKDTFTASDVWQYVKENHRTHWLGQVEQSLWNSPVWSRAFLPVLQREGASRVTETSLPGTRYTIPLPTISESETDTIFEKLADRFRGANWQPPFLVHRSMMDEESYNNVALVKWIGEDHLKFGRWWGTVALPSMSAKFGLQRAPSGAGYRIWPESDDDAARELIRLMPVGSQFEAEDAYGKFKEYAYPQADRSLSEFKQYLEERMVVHLQRLGVGCERGGFLGRGERIFTVDSNAKSRVRQNN